MFQNVKMLSKNKTNYKIRKRNPLGQSKIHNWLIRMWSNDQYTSLRLKQQTKIEVLSILPKKWTTEFF